MTSVQDLASEVRSRAVEMQTLKFDTEQIIGAAFDDLALKGQVMSNESEMRVQVMAQVSGYGVLQPLLDDESIEEIWINRPDEVILARGSEVVRLDLDLPAESIRTLVLRMLRNSGRRVDTSLPFADAVLGDGSRLHVVIPSVTAQHWAVNVRKFPKSLYSLEKLVLLGAVSDDQAAFCVRRFEAARTYWSRVQLIPAKPRCWSPC